ncbi:vWA domain-containing protein [Clostridium hydrogeniformans]|uniref:vWA domain-containing protein n=1 Tax=Clostridium hydrogeniformans TaxID=349933 RepID=UPI000485CD6A|nr:VWA domain-containing protein [Clostridium hydrogeniformans]
MTLADTKGLWFLLSIPLFILMYILKQKLKEEEVSSLYLWKEVIRNTEARRPFDKLRKNILFFIQLLLILLLILSIANPYISMKGRGDEDLILIIDTSGSMKALNNDGKSRFNLGKDYAEDIVKNLSKATSITLISSGGSNKVEISSSRDKGEVLGKIKSLEPSNEKGDIENSYSLLKSLSKDMKAYNIVAISDRNIEFKDLKGRLINPSKTSNNLALDFISNSRKGEEVKVMVRIINYGLEDDTADISLYGDDKLIDVKTLDVKKGETKNIYFDGFKGDYSTLWAEISKKDSLEEDNRIYSVLKSKTSSKIMVFTDKNIFLEKALNGMKDIEVYKGNDIDNIPTGYDLYIFDGQTPKTINNDINALFINPYEDTSIFKIEGSSEGEEFKPDIHNITKFMSKSSFVSARYSTLEKPHWGENIFSSNNKTIGFVGMERNRKIGVLGFDLHNTDFPLKPEFPIFMNNLVSYMMDRNFMSKRSFYAGEKIALDINSSAKEVNIKSPSSKTKTLDINKGLSIVGEEVGVYEVTQKVDDREIKYNFVVNFPKEESNISIEGEVTNNVINNKVDIRASRSIQKYIIIAILLLLMMEWFVYTKGEELWGYK